jgi:hypothetical protein
LVDISVGPPKILQFNSENNARPIENSKNEFFSKVERIGSIDNVERFMKDFNVYINGGEQCEFCGNIIKSWPTIEKQENNNLIQVGFI